MSGNGLEHLTDVELLVKLIAYDSQLIDAGIGWRDVIVEELKRRPAVAEAMKEYWG